MGWDEASVVGRCCGQGSGKAEPRAALEAVLNVISSARGGEDPGFGEYFGMAAAVANAEALGQSPCKWSSPNGQSETSRGEIRTSQLQVQTDEYI